MSAVPPRFFLQCVGRNGQDDNLVLVVIRMGRWIFALEAQGSQEERRWKGDAFRSHMGITPSTKKVEEMFVSDIMIETQDQ